MRVRVSVFQLVLFAVGCLSLPSSAIAEDIVLPYPLYTNQFTTVEAWVELNTEAGLFLTPADFYDYYYNRVIAACDSLDSSCDSLLAEVDTHLYSLQDSINIFDRSQAWSTNNNLALASAWANCKHWLQQEMGYHAAECSNIVSSVSSEVSVVRSVMEELSVASSRDVITSVTFGQEYGQTLPGGGCQCPDYTSYLSSLQSTLLAFRAEVSDVLSWLSDFRDGWQSVISTDYTSGSIAAETLVKYWAWDWSMSVTNDVTVSVTNAPSNPLWVSITNNYPLLVQLVPDEPPLSVSVTNLVDVNVVNFEDLVYMLTNRDSTEERSQAELDFAQSKLRGQEDPDEEDDELEDVSLDDLDEIGGKLQEITESYKEMFDTNLVPTEMPNSIVLHQGYRLGPITVSSMHWNPDSKTGRLLRGMRSLFRAFWFVIYMVLLYYCAAVDMLIAGALLSCCFGVLMGKPEKITTGISRVWRLFVSMLGVSPSSSE